MSLIINRQSFYGDNLFFSQLERMRIMDKSIWEVFMGSAWKWYRLFYFRVFGQNLVVWIYFIVGEFVGVVYLGVQEGEENNIISFG